MPIAVPNAVPKKKRTLLPLLTVVFLLSYGLMTMLIVEQGSVIQSQSNLIQILMRDSRELWGMRGKALTDQQAARRKLQGDAPVPSVQTPSTKTPSTQIPSAQTPSTQAPSTQAPSTQAPSTQTPSTQAVPHHAQSHLGRSAKPQLPPAPASDLVDQRRALRTI
jgi:hypothetical protein